MQTYQPVSSHEDLVGVVDGLLEEMSLDRRDTGGKVTGATGSLYIAPGA
jgi:hypothetical protein